MDQENAIEVRDVKKTFKVYMDKSNLLKEKVLFWKRNRYETRHVLDGISFNVKKGEAVGLIGHNGCGKSTTLKLLTRIMYPTSGTIEMRGRVSSLIELGAGFHADMSGRENIYINAAIFGLTKKEIDARLDDIIEFSELQDYIDNPVRTYSSGMYMRLAFSVAINVDADILLVDEILAVGDAGFQTKCFNRLKEIKAEGKTIVIVSHSMAQIEQICDRSIWIHQGKIKAEGDPHTVDAAYLDYMSAERKEIAKKEMIRKGNAAAVREAEKKQSAEKPKDNKRWGSKDAVIEEVVLLDDKHEAMRAIATGDPMTIRIRYSVKTPVEDADFGIGIFRIDGTQCYGTNTRIDQLERFDLKEDGILEVVMDKVYLLQGKYWLDVAIERPGGLPVDYWRDTLRFDVFSKLGDVGVSRIPHEWLLDVGEEA